MKTLLIIGYVWPEPNSSAAGSRMLQLIQLFSSQAWHIVFASAAALSEHRADLSAYSVQEASIALNDSSFNEFIARIKPDVVLFDRFFTEEQFGWRVEQACPEAIRILDTEDLHSLRYARHHLLKEAQKNTSNETERQSISPVQAELSEIYTLMAQDDMAQREIAAIFRCDLTLMISQFEMELLKNYFSVPDFLLMYIPFLHVQIPNLQALPTYSQRHHFIAIGNFRHEPNWDSVLYLKHAIWPLIRAQLPQVELHIYGAYPPPKATQLHNPKQGFCVKGWANNAHAVMRDARVCLAPLRFGAGIKGKLMDAMLTATPSVTTGIGAEAMCGHLPWAGLVENNAHAFAQSAIQLYENENIWRASQQKGIDILRDFFSQEDYAQSLLQRVADLEKTLGTLRSNNFIGAMLRHHHHKSTQYMSQWIEAKNK